jgi:hypothetical protein
MIFRFTAVLALFISTTKGGTQRVFRLLVSRIIIIIIIIIIIVVVVAIGCRKQRGF